MSTPEDPKVFKDVFGQWWAQATVGQYFIVGVGQSREEALQDFQRSLLKLFDRRKS